MSARPLGELIPTVLWDRGGAPLHFVLSHLTLALDSSPEALRWLSVVFALRTMNPTSGASTLMAVVVNGQV